MSTGNDLYQLKEYIAHLTNRITPHNLAAMTRSLESDDLETLRLSLAELSQLIELETHRRENANASRRRELND